MGTGAISTLSSFMPLVYLILFGLILSLLFRDYICWHLKTTEIASELKLIRQLLERQARGDTDTFPAEPINNRKYMEITIGMAVLLGLGLLLVTIFYVIAHIFG